MLALTRRTSSRQHLLKVRNNVGNMKTRARRLKILRSHVSVAFKATNSTFKITPGLKSQNKTWPLINSAQQKQTPCLLI